MVTKKRPLKRPTLEEGPQEPPVGPPVEFFNTDDNAWYTVQVVLLAQTLIVKYTEFQVEKDVHFHVNEFTNSEKLSNFKLRFRKLSLQLEPCDCWKVEVGLRVCALSVHSEFDRRFYDAVVEAVKREEHIFVDDTENCRCTVVLSWFQGPNAGTMTTARIEDLCPNQSQEPPDPRVACFLALAKWKHGINSSCSKLVTSNIACNVGSPISVQCKSQSASQMSEGGKQMQSALLSDESRELIHFADCKTESFGHEINEDVDLGGGDQHKQNDDHFAYTLDKLVNDVFTTNLGERDNVENKKSDKEARYFIVVENLEKDVSPSTIKEFVKEAAGVEIEAFVFLNLSSEPCTRGALVVDCVEDLERLSKFLVKPGQMITSTKGRPWIMSDSLLTESVRPSFWCLEPGVKDERQQSADDGLKVVHLGSEEYSNAERLRDLFLAFANHQQLLFQRLASEEQRIFGC